MRRTLSPFEVAEARLVFGGSLNYARARVVEEVRWPDWVGDLGARLHPGDGLRAHNAVTIGNTSYFPVPLRTDEATVRGGYLRDFSWLIHELAHQWQYQHLGWRYLLDAGVVQLELGRAGYDYQGEHPSRESALRALRQQGRRLRHLNPEQQGDIARDYYYALRTGGDASPWEPFIAELKGESE
jgi:hypothetical protein